MMTTAFRRVFSMERLKVNWHPCVWEKRLLARFRHPVFEKHPDFMQFFNSPQVPPKAMLAFSLSSRAGADFAFM